MLSQRTRKVYVIVPITIPGMNKELFFDPFEKIIRDQGYEFSFIANKLLKKEAQERLSKSKKDQSLPPKEFKKRADYLAKAMYQEKLTELIQKKLAPGQHHFVYIEKNHPPEAWKGTFRLIADASGESDVEVVALVPESSEETLNFRVNQESVSFPFSVRLFVKCLDTIQKRKDHETLSGNGSESIGILLEFMDFFKDVGLDEKSIKKTKIKPGFDRVIYVSFVNQNQNVQLPPEIQEILINALKCEKRSPEREIWLERLNELYENANISFEDPEKETMAQYTYDFLQCLGLLKNAGNIGKIEKPESSHNSLTNHHQKSNEVKKKEEEKIEKSVEVNEEIKNSKVQDTNEQVAPKNHQINESEKVTEFSYDASKQKHPQFLGIFPKDFSALESKEYVLQALDVLMAAFPEDSSLKGILQDLQHSEFKLEENPHIVCLDIGQDKTKLTSPFYKKFKEKHSLEIKSLALVIIPGKLILSLFDPDQIDVEIEDNYPHMILSKHNWDSSCTEELFENLFEDDKPFNAEYDADSLNQEEKVAKKAEVKINEIWETVYFVKTGSHLLLDSETKIVR